MKRNRRVVGHLIVAAPVNVMGERAVVDDSARNTIQQALTQLGQALAAFGPFKLGRSMVFVQAGIRVDVLDASEEQHMDFVQTEFEAFVQRAHKTCVRVLGEPGDATEQLTAGADGFAAAEGCDVDAVKKLFTSMATRGGASLISAEGELIDIGIAAPATGEPDSGLEIEVARIRYIARIKTTDGHYDVSPDDVRELKVGDRIRAEGVEPATGAACIRADRIEDAEIDSTGELFKESVAAQPRSNPDDRK